MRRRKDSVSKSRLFGTDCPILHESLPHTFLGRLDDIGEDGLILIEEIATIFNVHGIKSEIIAASIRNPLHAKEAAKRGAHVGTLPIGVILKMLEHPLTTAGIERFLKDWEGMKK